MTAAQQLDLALLQLCFDESEFGSLEGALRSTEVGAQRSTRGGDDNDGTEPTISAHDGEEAANEEEPTAFDPQVFVATKLEYVTPEVLEQDLAAYARHLEEAVVRCVHDEVHEAFVDVSGQLVSIEPALVRVQQPLADMEDRVARSRSLLEAARESVAGKLDAAAEHELRRAFFAALLEASLIHNAAQRAMSQAAANATANASASSGPDFESSIASSPPPKSAASPTTGNDSAADSPTSPQGGGVTGGKNLAAPNVGAELSGICASVVRLKSLVATLESRRPAQLAAEDARLADAVTQYAAADAESAQELVNSHFLRCYAAFASQPSADSSDALSGAVSLFRQLHAEGTFPQFFANRVVRPVVERVVTWQAAAAAKTSPAETSRIFDALLVRLENGVLLAVPLLQRRLGASVSLLAAGVWPAIGDTLTKRMLHFFEVGNPAAFHRSFTVAAKLMSALERGCATAAELQSFRSCKEVARWRARWNLEAYHQLRFYEFESTLNKHGVTGEIFSASSTAGSSGAPDDIAPFSIPQFHHLLKAIQWLLGPEEVFLFPLQAAFIKDVCQAVHRFMAALQTAAGKAEPLAIVELIRNASAFTKQLDAQVGDSVRRALTDDAAAVPVMQLLRHVVDAGLVGIRRSLVDGLVHKCLANLSQVRSVKRVANASAMPVAPSVYLQDALRDVKKFKDDATKQQALSEAECRAVVNDALEGTTAGYQKEVKDALVHAKRQQASLDKLRKSAAAGATSAAPKDRPREKVVMQLYLDVEEYGALLRSFGVAKEIYEPYRSLLALVAPRAHWIINECRGEEPADPYDADVA